MAKPPPPLTYRDSGVDLADAGAVVRAVAPLARRTANEHCIGGVGGFGGLLQLPADIGPQPVLVAGADGVGTKLQLAAAAGRNGDVGVDLVAMCVNDILAHGARPLFFLDYYASGRLRAEAVAEVVAGICRGCEQAGCALLGGESAAMPGLYRDGDYDLAGFAVGAVNRADLIDGGGIGAGDAVIGIAGSGPHANGFSLVRAVLKRSGVSLSATVGGATLADALLAPTKIYVRPVLRLLTQTTVKGIAHITGGGIAGNLSRILPPGAAARVDASAWARPAVFTWLKDAGGIGEEEMLRTFNCGIGMALVVDAAEADGVVKFLRGAGEEAFCIGKVTAAVGGEQRVVIA